MIYIIQKRGLRMNEIVKYDNYMNGLYFSNFKEKELDLLMTLCARMRDKDITKVTFSFDELKKMSGYTGHNVEDFLNTISMTNDKLQKVACKIETDESIESFVLFPTYSIDKVNQMLTVRVNEDFKFVLNGITKNFTRFELSEFVNLNGKYNKNLYRLLKQYKTTGVYQVSVEELRSKLDAPTSYNSKQFMQNIINPSIKSLEQYFIDLKCEPQKAKKRGAPIIGYIFTFKPETESKQKRRTEQAKESFMQNRKQNKNRFNQFEQRNDVDMDELEQMLLSN